MDELVQTAGNDENKVKKGTNEGRIMTTRGKKGKGEKRKGEDGQ